MEQSPRQYFIIDFDNTFIKSEGFEELAAIALKNHPHKEHVLKKIKELAMLSIEGKMPLAESLDKRLALFQANRQDVEREDGVEHLDEQRRRQGPRGRENEGGSEDALSRGPRHRRDGRGIRRNVDKSHAGASWLCH